jgi:hypothetical protein
METLSIILSYLGILLWVFGLYLAFFSKLRGMFATSVMMIWKRKYLWLLAFFAGLTAYGGEINVLFQRVNTITSLQGFLEGFRTAILQGQVEDVVRTVRNLWGDNMAFMSGSAAIVILIAAVLIWLIITSQAAIVRIVGRTEQGSPTGLNDGLAIGTEKFWILLQLNLIGLLIGWALWVILTGVPAAIFLLTKQSAWTITAYFGAIASIVGNIISIFLVQFATAGIVLRDEKLMPAIVGGWRLFVRNVVSSLEMAIAIFTINVTLSFFVVAVLLFFVSAYTLAGFLTIVSVIVLLYALLSAFSFSAWTTYYLKLVEGSAPSYLGKWTNQLVNFAGQKRATR